MSRGGIERAICELEKTSAMRSKCEEAFGQKLSADHNVLPWTVRRASCLLMHYLVKAHGETPYERLRGRVYNGQSRKVRQDCAPQGPTEVEGHAEARRRVVTWRVVWKERSVRRALRRGGDGHVAVQVAVAAPGDASLGLEGLGGDGRRALESQVADGGKADASTRHLRHLGPEDQAQRQQGLSGLLRTCKVHTAERKARLSS